MTYRVYSLVSSGVIDTCFSPDGSRLYASSGGGNIAVFDVATHQRVATWHVDGSLTSISVSDDGKYLLALGGSTQWSGFARFNTANGHAVTVQEDSPVGYRDIQVVNDHEAILSGSGAYRLDRVDIVTGQRTTLASGPGPADADDLSRDGRYTLMADKSGSNGALYLYDGSKDRVVAMGDDYQNGVVSGFNDGIQAISRPAGLVAQYIGYGNINIYDVKLHAEKSMFVNEALGGMAFDSRGRHLFTYAVETGIVHEYRTTDWTIIKSFQIAPSDENSNDENYADSLLVSANDKFLTITDYHTGALTLIDLTKHSDSAARDFGTTGPGAFGHGTAADHHPSEHVFTIDLLLHPHFAIV